MRDLGAAGFSVAAFLCCLSALAPSAAAQVVFSEIMYHPASESPQDQWFELQNTGGGEVSLAGWQIRTGVQFDFPSGTVLPPRGALVVAADAEAFVLAHPAVSNVVGGWTGKLAREGERLVVTDAGGNSQAEIVYATEGDWATLRLGAADKYTLAGWEWYAAHDGAGMSLERVSLTLPASAGQNWRASLSPGGTPGRANSVAETDSAPLVTEVRHVPAVPRSGDTVSVTLRLVDEAAGNAGVSAALLWRVNSNNPPAFSTLPLRDDGAEGDAIAQDGLYSARLPPQPDGTVVEYAVTVSDAGGLSRTYPGFQTNAAGRTACLLYQVDNGAYSGTQPFLRLILSAAEYAFLSGPVWTAHPQSDAQVCGTLIYQAPGNSAPEVYPRALLRNRGNGTRTENPHNIRLGVPADKPWGKRTSVNLNTERTHSQNAGSALARLSGLPMPESRAVQVRINGQNLALPGTPQFGAYAMNESLDQAFADRQFPTDSEGNLYRGIRNMIGSSTADLRWLGASYGAYTNAFKKENNSTANDWSDFIALVDTLNNCSDANYTNAVTQILNADQWMLYFAFNTLTGNRETCLGTGIGDDFALFCGVADPRFLLLPYDMDSILGQSDGIDRATTYGDGLWRMVQSVPAVTRFVQNPAYAPLYFGHLRKLADSVFQPERINALLDALLGDHVTASTLANMKAFNASHRTYVLSQIPSALAITNTFGKVGSYSATPATAVNLSGVSDAVRTRRVTVNGAAGAWTAWKADWGVTNVSLRPGLNHLVVCAYDADGLEFDRVDADLLCTAGNAAAYSGGTLETNAAWRAACGPHRLDGPLTVASGVTLTVDAGASVYLGSGASLIIADGGRLLAEGTTDAPVTFCGVPGSPAWKQLLILGSAGAPETRITYAHITDNGDTAIRVEGGSVLLDHLTFGAFTNAYLSLDGASFMVSHCTFPATQASCVPVSGGGGIRADGRGVFFRNMFGSPAGSNDVVRFSGGVRGRTPLVHFIENVFDGSGDDSLDLAGADAWIEGNLFLHNHKNGAPDSSCGVGGGNNPSAPTNTSEVTLVGNVFYDCDFAATAKQGGFFSFCNNTILRQTHKGGTDTNGAVIAFEDAQGGPAEPGLGACFADNVIGDIERLTSQSPQLPATFTNNVLPVVWDGRGGGNLAADPCFAHASALPASAGFKTWQQAQAVREWLALKPGAPGRGAGRYGQDQGAVIPRGILIAGVPPDVTTNTSAILRFGPLGGAAEFGAPVAGFPDGSGYPRVRYRLLTNGAPGAWSAARPTAEPLVLEGLSNATYAIEASGELDTGLNQDDPALGEAACVTRSSSWTVDTSAAPSSAKPPLSLSEVLAKNLSTAVYDNSETRPDLIELYNAGAVAVDLAGMRLTDDPGLQARYVFPSGTSLGPGTYLTVVAGSKPSGYSGALLHTGFSLSTDGETLSLCGADGTLLDQVTFGLQIPDYSIGRAGAGVWTLCTPTFGSANAPAALADLAALKINEWLARVITAADEFVELYNPSSLPADISGCALSDAPGAPGRHRMPALCFIAPGGYACLLADGDAASGANHLGFKLATDAGSITLYSPGLEWLDGFSYGTQQPDVSEGRSPNGGTSIVALAVPTPGSGNPVASSRSTLSEVVTETQTLVAMTNTWRCSTNGVNLGSAWRSPGYDDSAWPSGRALFYAETAALAAAKNTPLPLGFVTYYFRTAFTVGTNLTGWSVNVSTLIDDGAVVYLNGQELFRQNMPSGAITAATNASASVEATLQGPYDLPLALLQTGTNKLAVEVHQSSASSSDVVFGLAVQAVRTVTNGPPFVSRSLIDMTGTWKYDQTGTNRGTAWRVPDYDDAAWPAGAALLYNETATLPAAKNTPLTLGATTYYFRKAFSVTDDFADAVLNLSTIIDDGAVIYLNGSEVMRLHMPAGIITNATLASGHEAATEGPFLLSAGILQKGTNVLAVEVHQDSASSSDIVFGLSLEARVTLPVTENIGVRLSELFTTGLHPPDRPDWIELLNTGTSEADLSDMSLTDRIGEPRRYVFPFGTRIPASSYLVVPCSAVGTPGETGFALDSGGGGVYLFDTPAAGGALADAVVYGLQPGGYSLARQHPGADDWQLAAPSPLTTNRFVTLGSAGSVRVNEWMASASGEDWFELMNTGAEPVALGELWLTDTLSDQAQQRIAPRSFIGAGDNAWALLIADGKPASGANHVSFKLNASGEALALLKSDGTILDVTSFGEQVKNVSQGRFPDGAARVVSFTAPTPGSSNVLPPQEADSDEDGMSDAFEARYAFDPADPLDGLLDSDGDGVCNAGEYWAGTSPRDCGDVLRIVDAYLSPGGGSRFVLLVPVSAGRSYTVQACTNLALGVWTRLTDLTPQPATGLIAIEDDAFSEGRYYRVVMPAVR